MIFGNISNIQDFSVNDGEGIRTTVFFSGCPLRCPWCSNPETLYTPGTIMSADQVFDKIRRSMIFFQNSGGGVTFSGGEPTGQPDFLNSLIDKCQRMGIHTAMESCGYFTGEEVWNTLEKLDLIFFDLKHMDASIHQKATGKSNLPILENIHRGATLGKEMVIRIPLVHPFNDTTENIRATAQFISSALPDPKVEILPYHFFGMEKYEALHRPYPGKDFSTPTPERIEQVKNILRREGITIVKY